MKIVNIIGGLGNQMFQYAFAVALKSKFPNEDIKIGTQLYQLPVIKKYKGNNFYHNGFEVQKIFPKADLPIASFVDIFKVSYYIPNYIVYKAIRRIIHYRESEFLQAYINAYVYDLDVFNSDASYFEGYWMNPLYFKFCRNDLFKAFSFREFDTEENKKWASLMASDDSVTIHVRRGDYIGAENFKDICTLAYYRNAVKEARKKIVKPVFFIFSNDQKWCKENLKDELGNARVYFVTNNQGKESYRDMQLMSISRCNILANSSFSWWGAYLNQRKNHIVFCPEKWVNNLNCESILLNEWIKISGKNEL